MYCIQCGVQLADYETKCPLCGTRVYHPDLVRADVRRPYPKPSEQHPEMNRAGVIFLLSFLFLVPILLVSVCDLSINGTVVWSGYTVGALLLLYLTFVLPFWFRAPNPAFLVAVDFVGILIYLLYINHATGGKWFFTFALPVTVMLATVVCILVALFRKIKHGELYIIGGALLLFGGMTVALEVLINLNFKVSHTLVWSVYPLVVFVLLGLWFLLIATCKPLRELLHKKFFL